MLSKVVSTGGMSNLPQRTLNVPTTWRHIRFKAIFKYLSDSCFVLFISSDFCLKRKRYSGRAAAALERRFRKIYGVSSSWRRDCVEKHTHLQRMHHNATEVKRNSLMVFVRWFYLKKKKKKFLPFFSSKDELGSILCVRWCLCGFHLSFYVLVSAACFKKK